MKRGRIALAALALLAVSCGRLQKSETEEHLFLSGRIEGDEIDLAFKLGGRIGTILVREGDSVEPGQVLALLEGEQERVRLKEAEARLDGARARLEQARLQVPTLETRLAASRLVEEQAGLDAPSRVAQAEAQALAARAELRRAQAEAAQARQDAVRYAHLAEKGAAPRQLAEQHQTRAEAADAAVQALDKQVTAAESGVAVARAALRVPEIRGAEAQALERQIQEARAAVTLAQSDVAAAAAAVERARADVAELELKAPAAGTIVTRASEPGRVVAPGATVLTLVDLAGVYLRGFVPEGKIGLVKVGQRAEVFLDSAPDRPLEAEVMRIDPQAMFTPENTYFREERVKQVVGVKLLLKSGAGYAKPGMPADARIHVR